MNLNYAFLSSILSTAMPEHSCDPTGHRHAAREKTSIDDCASNTFIGSTSAAHTAGRKRASECGQQQKEAHVAKDEKDENHAS